MDLSKASGRCFSSIKAANEFRLASRNLFGTRERVLSSGRRWILTRVSSWRARARACAFFEASTHVPSVLLREMRNASTQTFYVLCELCAAARYRHPRNSIFKLADGTEAPPSPSPPASRWRNEKKVVGQRNIIIMTFVGGKRVPSPPPPAKINGRRINFNLVPRLPFFFFFFFFVINFVWPWPYRARYRVSYRRTMLTSLELFWNFGERKGLLLWIGSKNLFSFQQALLILSNSFHNLDIC